MRVLIDDTNPGLSRTILDGWTRALLAANFEVAGFGDNAAFDVFDTFKPDVFIETQERSRAISKCVAARPDLILIDQREPLPGFDSFLYQRRGEFTPALACDLTFVAEWTPEKAPLFRHFLDPIVLSGKYKLKFFGAGKGGGCPYVQHLGWIDDQLLPDLYASARYCLDLSDIMTERYLQIVGLGGRAISNVGTLSDREDIGIVIFEPDNIVEWLDGEDPDDGEILDDDRRFVLSEFNYAVVLGELFHQHGLVDEARQLREIGRRMVHA